MPHALLAAPYRNAANLSPRVSHGWAPMLGLRRLFDFGAIFIWCAVLVTLVCAASLALAAS